ncbi:pseudouridine synthase [Treponema pedis]|uniref:pseudouridine synthase n=1 Tax=Treponema pedis TaxID=409322 RepID=UPI00197FCE53|nr:pseudouridine synthase [Treponema pedis]QSI04858.1 RNA pseudouridine synthase [Treponema pedis]
MEKDFFYGNKIKILFENNELAVLYKPRGVPTAPIKKEDKNTLVNFFLNHYPEGAKIIGKKQIEAGLIHRLDTATCGSVLFAKTQDTYDELNTLQLQNLITKTYFTFSDIEKNCDKNFIDNLKLPYKITSQFSPFGPRRKKVIPVFEKSRRFKDKGKMYTTTITSVTKKFNGKFFITCTLTQGFRHQVRSHLSYCGLPICGDALYNSNYNCGEKEAENHEYPLQLYAAGICFPKLKSSASFPKANRVNDYISFLLPPPNKTTP